MKGVTMEKQIGIQFLKRQTVKNTIWKILCMTMLMLGIILIGCGKSDNFSGTWAGIGSSAWDSSPLLQVLKIQKNGESYIVKRYVGSYNRKGNLDYFKEMETMTGTLKDANILEIPIAFGGVLRITFVEKDKELMSAIPMLKGAVYFKKYDDIDKVKQKYQNLNNEGTQQNVKDKSKNNVGTTAKSESSNATNVPSVPKANNGQASASAEYPAITKSAYVNAYHSSADQEGNYVHSAKLTIDGNTGSCWSEGVKGIGIGENIEIHFNGNYKVSGMNIWIGHQKSQDLFSQNARPTALRVEGSDGSKEIYNLEDKFGPQRIAFKTPITANKVKLIVERVAPGSKYEDTCISEVEFF